MELLTRRHDDVQPPAAPREDVRWEEPDYEVIEVAAEVTAYTYRG